MIDINPNDKISNADKSKIKLILKTRIENLFMSKGNYHPDQKEVNFICGNVFNHIYKYYSNLLVGEISKVFDRGTHGDFDKESRWKPTAENIIQWFSKCSKEFINNRLKENQNESGRLKRNEAYDKSLFSKKLMKERNCYAIATLWKINKRFADPSLHDSLCAIPLVEMEPIIQKWVNEGKNDKQIDSILTEMYL